MRIAFLNWRDSTHPEGGGAEKYAETVCAGLAAAGHEVTLLCARHPGSAVEEVRDGVRVLRQGGRLGVYPASVRRLRALERTGGRFDAVVDTQNGVPFLARLATRSPAVVLVHHVHREQWPIVFGPVAARVGWFVESRVAPRLLRGSQYVAVSERTRDELAGLGVDPGSIAVVHNGTEPPLLADRPRHPDPRLVVLGRVVPHKRVEHAIAVLAALADRHPRLRLRVVGDGWWREEVATAARRAGVGDRVDLLGFVDEETKHAELAAAWVALAPSVKEGWGLCVVEAATHATPTVAYRGAGGLSESILDGESGLLVDDLEDLTRAVDRLLVDDEERERLGAGAVRHAARFTWAGSVEAWITVLTDTASRRVPTADRDAELSRRSRGARSPGSGRRAPR
ncbi:glycosyltransferase family 4 protein [Phycicoccus sp. BSK3Z-2]|uniref:Glycosyltransferase family 4 protein n=1 Tax=Phycicoccus avicenniae TaxID=2828860 RepID=A0A941D7F4_9MICO|nr:glycosyltransferase family 4 protein [Phycicoccus avicenniae]MBR7742185.1 glycosyltransferase family 4 protein [Phycicoccus avicenniae]